MKLLILTTITSFGLAACGDSSPSAPKPTTSRLSVSTAEIVPEDLGTLPGGVYSYLNDVNESGHAVGDSRTATGVQRAIRWSEAEGMIDLGTLPGGSNSAAWTINDAGDIAGYSSTIEGDHHAVLWPADGSEMIDLGTLGGHYSEAFAINNLGQVVGQSYSADFELHAFVWSRATGMIDLTPGRIAPGTAAAYGLNDDGQIVGHTSCAAVIWQPDGSVTRLGSLGGFCSQAFGISDKGNVVGASHTASGDLHAFLWERNVGMTELRSVGSTTWAIDIDKSDAVVGHGTDLAGHDQAALWDKANGLTVLGTLGGCCAAAGAMNENGEIVGYSSTPDGSFHATRWKKHDKKPKP